MKKCKKKPKRPTQFCKLAKRKMSGKAKCCKWVTVRESPDDQDDDDDDDNNKMCSESVNSAKANISTKSDSGFESGFPD